MPKINKISQNVKCRRRIRKTKKKILLQLKKENPELNISSNGVLTSSKLIRESQITTNCVSDRRNSFVVQEQEDQNASTSLNSHEMFDPFAEIENISSKIVITDPTVTHTVQKFLQKWINECKVNQNHARILLRFLNFVFPTLPIDPRTIMGTMRSVTKDLQVFMGKYVHIGLQKNLEQIFFDQTPPDKLNIDFFIDGFSLFKNARENEIWCILGRLHEKKSEIFSVGLYFGESKPGDFSLFLKMFVDETSTLERNCVIYNKRIELKVRVLIMDSPAKSSVLGTKACHAKCGCSRCMIRGEFLNNRMSFHKMNPEIIQRTDQSFRSRTDEEYHIRDSPIEKLNIDIIQQVVNEPFHLLYLGIAKSLMKIWFGFGGRHGLFGKEVLSKIGSRIVRLMDFHPEEFQRSLDTLDKFMIFKGSQFRCFVLYTGPFLLQDILPHNIYNNFLQFHIIAKVLSDEKLCVKCIPVIKKIINDFLAGYAEIYGKEFIVPNLHALIHLPENVEFLKAPLEDFSAFPFESHISSIKSLVKNHKNPLEEISRRLIEKSKASNIASIKLCMPTNIVKIPRSSENQSEFLNLEYHGYKLGVSRRRSYVLTIDGKIIKIKRFRSFNNKITVVGEEFMKKCNFYNTPIESKFLDTWQANTNDVQRIEVPLSNLKRKLYAMSDLTNNKMIFFPMQEFSCSAVME